MRVVTLSGTQIVATPSWSLDDERVMQGWLHPMALWRTATAPLPPWDENNAPNMPTEIAMQAKFGVIGVPIALALGAALGYFLGKRYG